jgi:S1-C subfamily serine protease
MEDYGQYMIWADAEVRPGMSGGGLLDQEGRLIGILSGGSQDGELAAVPLSLILQFMEDMDSASR